MKKLFTLIAALAMVLGMNARTSIDFSSKDITFGQAKSFGNYEWIGLVLAQGEPTVNADKTAADDSNVTYFDASSYDYLCIKYNAATVDFSFILQYNCAGTVGQWGVEFNQDSKDITSNTKGMIAIKLDATKKKTINQIALQPKGAGSIVIEDIYWASEAEYTEDAANFPVVKDVPPTKDLDLASATNAWNDASFVTYDVNTHTATIVKNDGASGWWVSTDCSDYQFLVLEILNMQKVGYAQLNGIVSGSLNDGSYIKVIDVSDKTLSGGFNLVIQGGAGTTWTWQRAYFATAEYVQQNGIKDAVIWGDTQDMTLADLSSGWNAEYDAASATITVLTEKEEGGKGWWVKGDNGADYSHFDNFVVELESTEFDGKVVVQYVDPAAAPALAPSAVAPESSEQEFGVGATCIVVPLSAEGKTAVQQLWIQGAQGAKFTIKKAYLAVASATPEANLGVPSGIQAINAEKNVNAPIYNLSGQRVDAQYKGVVIQNGKKFMQK